MKKLMCFILIFIFALLIFPKEDKGISRMVYYNILDTSASIFNFIYEPYDSLTFKAWIEGKEVDIITQKTTGCGFENLSNDSIICSAAYINLGNFSENWNVGEILHIDIICYDTNFPTERGCIWFHHMIESGTGTIWIGFEEVMPGTGYELIMQNCHGDIDDNGYTPELTNLKQNYPNPFNPTTTIEFEIDKGGVVDLNIFNQSGEIVKNVVGNFMKAGKHSVGVDLSNLSAGTYYYVLKVDGVSEAKKMVLVK